MPALRLCSIAATILSRSKCWRPVRCAPPLFAIRPSARTSNTPSSCSAKSSSRRRRAFWVARSIAFLVSLSIRECSLHDDLLALADKAGELIADAIEGLLKLFFGFDAAREELADRNRREALTFQNLVHFRDCRSEAAVTKLGLGTKVANCLVIPVL